MFANLDPMMPSTRLSVFFLLVFALSIPFWVLAA